MARKIRLVDTGELVDKKPTHFRAPNKKWFSSYDAYLEYDLDNQNRIRCVEKMYDLMGYEKKQQINKLFYKRLKEWREGYSYQVILKAMEMSTEPIEYSFRIKDFDTENSKLFYAMAIINNQLNDALKLSKLEHKVNKVEKNKDLDMFANGIEVMQHICGNIKANDVSHLAGDL